MVFLVTVKTLHFNHTYEKKTPLESTYTGIILTGIKKKNTKSLKYDFKVKDLEIFKHSKSWEICHAHQ